MKTKATALAAGLIFLMSSSALAGVPPQITFMGRLLQGGTPVTSPVNMTFALYLTAAGGSSVWSDAQSVTPNGTGVYVAKLGSAGNPIPVGNDTLWIQVTVGSTTLSPRRQLTSTPFALRADLSDDVGTLPNLDVIGNASIGGNVGIGTVIPDAMLHIEDTEFDGLGTLDESYGGAFTISGGSNDNNKMTFGVRQNPTTLGIIQVFNDVSQAGNTISLNPRGGNVGIGTTSPGYRLEVNGPAYFQYVYTNLAGGGAQYGTDVCIDQFGRLCPCGACD